MRKLPVAMFAVGLMTLKVPAIEMLPATVPDPAVLREPTSPLTVNCPPGSITTVPAPVRPVVLLTLPPAPISSVPASMVVGPL